MTELGSRIALRRRELKLTQAALAKKLNVTRQTISSWEVGRTEPDVDALTPLAAALQWEVSDLLGMEPAKPGRRLRLVPALLLTLSALAFTVVCLLVSEWAKLRQAAVYDTTPGLVCAYILRPTLWCFWGITVVHVAAAIAPIPLSKRLSVALLILGIASIVLLILIDGFTYFGFLHWSRTYNWFFTGGRPLFFIPGLLISLGIQPHRR